MIDFHSHLDLYPDPRAVARECMTKGIYVLSVTTTPSAWNGSSNLSDPTSRIRTALGLHPQLAHERKCELELFDEHIRETRYVGEIGLDGAPEFKQHWHCQTEVFEHILRTCSKSGGKIMSIHSRRAAASVLDTLRRFPDAGIPILHWYSGNKHDLDLAISSGCWFSVGPAMFLTEKSKALIKCMPRNRVLTETDGPFVQLNGRSAMPWDAQQATVALQNIWNVSQEETEHIVHENFRRLVATHG